MKDLVLPVKYAIQPLYPDKYKKGSKVEIGHIVTKVFLVKEIKEYLTDGKVAIHYHVVFPYRNKDNYGFNDKRILPQYRKIGYYDKICMNSNFVRDIYETYDEAKMVCSILNAPFDKNINEIQNLEDNIKEATEDLIVTK